MKLISKTLVVASMASAALVAGPATAQVQGNMAVVNGPVAVINSQAFRTAYQQVNTTYASQLTTLQQRAEERQTLLRQLDTNSDGQLDEAEQQAAQNSSQGQRIQQIEQEVNQLSGQVDAARVYAIEQILPHYSASLQQVVQQQQIQMVLTPDAVIYAPPQANISQQVATAIDGRTTAVSITPPENWQPTRSAVAMFQQIQQALLTAQALQQQQAAQQGTQQQPTQPTGR